MGKKIKAVAASATARRQENATRRWTLEVIGQPPYQGGY
jgi:hypothetical protein